jgi:Na+-transporting NADH:ubiquinone oxidoreductase subunit NqrC
MPNTNQTLFIVIFSLIAAVIVLLTYVCLLKRMKISAKRDLLYEQHQLERSQQQQQQELSSTQLQQLKPVLLQKLYDQDVQRQRQMHNEQVPQYTPHSSSNHDILVNINDESERDATIIHTEQPPLRNNTNQPQNPFADNV